MRRSPRGARKPAARDRRARPGSPTLPWLPTWETPSTPILPFPGCLKHPQGARIPARPVNSPHKQPIRIEAAPRQAAGPRPLFNQTEVPKAPPAPLVHFSHSDVVPLQKAEKSACELSRSGRDGPLDLNHCQPPRGSLPRAARTPIRTRLAFRARAPSPAKHLVALAPVAPPSRGPADLTLPP